MKPNFNKRYATIAIYSGLVLLICIFFVFALLNFGYFKGLFVNFLAILSPIILGAILAYAFSPIVTFFETKVYHILDKKKKYHLKRVISVISMFVLIIIFLLLLIMIVIPNVFEGYADLTTESGGYLEELKKALATINPFDENHFLHGYFPLVIEFLLGLLDDMYGKFAAITPDIAEVAGVVVGILGNVILGIILSIYFLFAKEKILAQFKKFARSLLSRKRFSVLERSVRVTNEKFGGFLKGQLWDSLIIGILCYLGSWLLHTPYYPLVSALVAIAAFVPVFGLLIGTILGAIIILLVDPFGALLFVLFMIALYLINKALIKPRIMRITVDASSVFMFAAIIITSGFLGFWGYIFGVPLFAVLYTFLHAFVNKRLIKRGITTDAYDYYATKAGKELYVEHEVRKKRRRHARGQSEDSDDIFVAYDHEGEDGELLFDTSHKKQSSSEHEFPQ